jgi:hypothetical protein
MKIAQNISGTLGLWNLVGRITVIDYPGQRVCLFADTDFPQEVLAGVSVSVPHTCEIEGCPPERPSGFPAAWIPAHTCVKKSLATPSSLRITRQFRAVAFEVLSLLLVTDVA